MHFAFTDEELEFQREVQEFATASLPPEWRWKAFNDSDEGAEWSRNFCKALAAKDWLTLSWPREYGGAQASLWEQLIFAELMRVNGEPRGPQYMNLNYIGPTIMAYGSEEQKAQFLPAMARGEINFCQGFSEPDAGSDLASLQTGAMRDGDEYVINGTKIWTSYATIADYRFLLARTDPEAPKHRGISLFLVPMNTPGITVHPIRSMSGWGDINQVFFDNVRIPATARVGEENRGWYIATGSLNLERILSSRWARAHSLLMKLVERVKQPRPDGSRLADEEWVRQKIADAEVSFRAAQLLSYRCIWQIERGEQPSWEISLARLHNTQLEQKVTALALEVLGHYGLDRDAEDPSGQKDEFELAWRVAIPATIAAGAIEVQKNLVANRGLGLPRS